MAKLSIKHLSSLFVLLLSVCVLSCTEGNNDVDWTEEKVVEVSSEMVPINIFGDPGVVDGMRVRIQGESQWSAFPIHFIEGFEFEPGYSYTLKVEITHLANPPQDSYDVAYKLIELISKTEVWARKKADSIE